MSKRDVMVQPPEDFTRLSLEPPHEVAAGLPSVLSTLSHAYEEPGLLHGTRLLLRMNQKDGFDCNSCAWPDPDGSRSIAEFCENGAKAISDEGTKKRLTWKFFAEHSVGELSRQTDYWLNKQGRLTEPMLLEPGSDHYRPISWDEAFERIGEHLRALDSPDEAIFYTSGRTSNEAAFLYQLFVREFGTNNMPDCSNMCHESSGTGLSQTIGIGKGTVTLQDFRQSDLILIMGQNPGTNHPRMLSALEEAKENGARIISINPLPETGLLRFKNPQDFLNPIKGLKTLVGSGTQLSDLFLPVKINGDVALLKGLMKALMALDETHPGSVLDRAFIEEKTEGFEEFLKDLSKEKWKVIEEQSGIAQADIEEAAEMIAACPRMIVCWAMGLTQHKNAVANVQEVVNLLLMRGSIGKPGAGACPVRGHSNVQGDRTVGIWERPPESLLEKLDAEFGINAPREHGYDTVDSIKAMHEGKARVFFAMGGNFLSATPDTEYTAEALQRCKLTVQVSTKLNRSHLVTGEEAIILPCLGRSETDMQAGGRQFVSCENSMGVVQRSQGMMEPASTALLSEPAIVAGVARATLGAQSKVDWEHLVADYDRIRDAIERCIPGFEDYNERVRRPGGFYLPNGPREGRFPTPSGKAQFTVHKIPRVKLKEGRYMMMTIRSHDQFNTTVYGLDDRYRGVHNERRIVFMNPEDMEREGLVSGQAVDITSHFSRQKREVRNFKVVPFPIPSGCVATYFPEANPLVPIGSVAEKSNTPASKSVQVSFKPAIGPNVFS